MSRPGKRGRLKLAVYHDGRGIGSSVGVGGSAMSVGSLLEHLDPDIDVVVVGVNSVVVNWIADQRPGTEARVIPAVSNKSDLRGMLEHLRTLRRIGPDILQVDLPTPWSGTYALLAGLLQPKVRVIAVEHTPGDAHNQLMVWMKRFLMSTTSANVAISQSLARFTEDIARQPRGSVRVINIGVEDLDRPSAARRAHEPPVIGTVARLTWQKGVDVFLRALVDVPSAVAVIVGEGEDRQQLEDLAAELGIAHRVTWIGWRADARDLLSSFDLFVLASRFEGLGRVLIEASLAECPVVATGVVGTRDVVKHGETGWIVPPDDPAALSQAIMTVLADEPLARGLGRRSRQYALSRFSPAQTARAYEALYEEITGGKYRRGAGRASDNRVSGARNDEGGAR